MFAKSICVQLSNPTDPNRSFLSDSKEIMKSTTTMSDHGDDDGHHSQ